MFVKTDKKNVVRLYIIAIIIQIIFAFCYYLDDCHSDSSKECSTVIPKWEEWQVWMPMIFLTFYAIADIMINCFIRCTKPKEDFYASMQTIHETRV